jgi:hypothetical protein
MTVDINCSVLYRIPCSVNKFGIVIAFFTDLYFEHLFSLYIVSLKSFVLLYCYGTLCTCSGM